MSALAPGCAGVGAGHLGRDPALVDKDQPVRADLVYLLAEALALGRDLGMILLGGPKRLLWDGPPLLGRIRLGCGC